MLEQALKGDDDSARLAAIAELERDASPRAVTILGEFFINVGVTGRQEAARALLNINTPQAQGYFRAALSDAQLTARRQMAMQALEANIETAYPFLQSLLRDQNATVRLNTVQVIQFIDTPRARALLQIAIQDSDSEVSQTALDALRGLGFAPSPTP
jgi:HEAT repeat protein